MINDSGPTIPTVTDGVVQYTDEQKVVSDLIDSRIKTFNTHRRARILEIKANICYLIGEQDIVCVNNTIQKMESQFETRNDEILINNGCKCRNLVYTILL